MYSLSISTAALRLDDLKKYRGAKYEPAAAARAGLRLQAGTRRLAGGSAALTHQVIRAGNASR